MSEQPRTVLQQPTLLRGYDPLKECVQWNTLVGSLAGLLICMSFIASPTLMNGALPVGEGWTSLTLFLLAMVFIAAGAAPVLPLRIRARREEQQRNVLRQGALQGDDQPLASSQPGISAQALSLPICLESRLNRIILPWIGAWALFVGVLFLLGYLWSSGSQGAILGALVELFSLTTPFIATLCLGAINLVQVSIAAHYFHPQLHIDGEGITARYGRDTVTIAWGDIRYFALINSKIANPGFKRKTPAREVFEISDGENRICWLAHQSLSFYRLLFFGETRLSDQNYKTFTEQLATLLMARTDLPLLDFRLAEKKRKQKDQHG